MFRGCWLLWGMLLPLMHCLPKKCNAQHEFGVSAFSDLPGADYHHPGWQSWEDGFDLDLAHIRHYIFHSGASYKDLIEESPDGLRLRLDQLSENLQPQNRLSSRLDFRTVGLRFTKGNFRLGFTHEVHFATEMDYTDDLISLLVEGNAGFIGQTLDLSLDGFFHTYNDYTLSLGWRVGKLGLSVRPRILFGQQLLLQDSRRLELVTDPQYYQLKLTTDFDIYSAGAIDFSDNNLFNYDFTGLQEWSFTSPHIGAAFDAGIDFQDGPWRAGLAIRDVGAIHWKGVIRNRSQRIADYDGSQVVDILDLDLVAISTELDSLRSLLEVTREEVDVKQNLRAQGSLSLSYNQEDRWQLGLNLLYLDREDAPYTVSASYWRRMLNILRVGGTLTWRDDLLHVGLMTDVELAKVHIYLAFDHLGAGIRPLRASDYQLSAGVALDF